MQDEHGCGDTSRYVEPGEDQVELGLISELAIEAAGVGTWVYHVESGAVKCSDRTKEMLRAAPGQPIDATISARLLHPDDRTRVLEAVTNAISPSRSDVFRIQFRFVFEDGDVRWMDVRGRALFEGTEACRRPVQIIGTMVDVTEFKEKDEELHQLTSALDERVRERTERMRELASRLTIAQHNERRRISGVLHDDVQQLLCGIRMKVSLMKEEIARGKSERLAEHADDVYTWIGDAISLTQRLTVDLSPPVLREEGLADALRWLQAQMSELYGVYVEIHADHAFRIRDEDMRVLLFQAIRELLLNVVEHAETDHAVVRLHEAEDDAHLIIDVVDRGRGFQVDLFESVDPYSVVRGDSPAGGVASGLAGVQERLALFGGSLDVISECGKGTRATIHAPVVAMKPGLETTGFRKTALSR